MSDFNRRGKLPFQVVSSSVNTGYNAELTAAVGRSFEIVNQHKDEYGELQDSPAQGPFTEQWVGGNQHRHIDLNTGNDDSLNRPEAFLISGSTDKIRVYGPTHFNINAAKASLTRDNVAKSPVNIKNIKNESRRLGNFSHNYQVVQTSGRDINQSLIENNLTASGVLTTKFVTIPDYYNSIRSTFITSSGDGVPAGDSFGSTISISGDSKTLLVSSVNSDIPSSSAGGISVFKKNINSQWFEEAFLTSSGDGNPSFDLLGNCTAINYNGTIVAASYSGDIPVANAGAVAIFRSGSSGWVQESTLLSGLGSNVGFGGRIDINESGDTIVIGAPSYNVPSTFGGGVFVYKSSSLGGWGLQQILTSSTGVIARQLGADVKINFDGTKIAAGGRFQNCIIMFNSGSSGWKETAYVTGSSSDLQFLGFQLSLNRNFDTMIAGAYISGINGFLDGQGSAILFTSSSLAGWKEEKFITPPEPGTNFNFGSSVDINKDGDFILIASQGYTGSYTQQTGAVYLYNKLRGDWNQETIIVHNSSSLGFGLVSSVKIGENGNKFYINCVSSSVLEFNRTYVSENSPYILPEEPNNKTVFVERFSAPGGKEVSSRGALDRESEQYAPNNSLITRNIKVRQPYYNQLTQHTIKINDTDLSNCIIEGNSITQFAFNNKTLNVASTGDAGGIYVSPDGTKLFVIGELNYQARRYDLSVPFDITTATYVSSFAVWPGQTPKPQSIFLSPDGLRMYVVGENNHACFQYSLTTAWDLSSGVSYTGNSLSVFSQTPSPHGIFFSEDGKNFYSVGSNKVAHFILSTPWNITTAIPQSTLTFSSPIYGLLKGVHVAPDGEYAFIISESPRVLIKLNLVKPWFLQNAEIVGTAELTSKDISVRGDRLFIVSNAIIYDYNIETGFITDYKIPKNSIQTIEEQSGIFVTASDYDNFWVQHAIPSTDLRYKWIADSVVDSTDIVQYQNPYDSQQLIFNSASLVISGTNQQFTVDNIGINSLIKDEKSIDLTTNTFNILPSIKLSASFSEISNTPYGFSSWKEIRTGEHPVARSLRNNNILSLEGVKSKVINGTQVSSRRSDSVKNYIETPVTVKFKPLKQVLDLKGSNDKYEFTFTHNNNLSTFVNTEVVDFLGVRENSQQTYDLLRKYYNDPTRATNLQNPVNKIESQTYSETLFPREYSTYLAETRARTQYILDKSTSDYTDRDNINIQLGKQRTFWRDSIDSRLRGNLEPSFNNIYYPDPPKDFYNSMNYKIQKNVQDQLLQGSTYISNNVIGYWNSATYQTRFTFASSHTGRSIKSFDNNREIIIDSIPVSTTQDFSKTSILITSGSNIKQYGIRVIDNGLSGELNYEKFVDYYYSSSATPINSQLTRVTSFSVLTQFEQRTGSIGYPSGTFPTYGNHLYPNSQYQSLPEPRPNYLAFLGGFESGSRNYYGGGTLNFASLYFFRYPPTGDIKSTLDSGLRYDTESFGDKKSWFDSYEKYSDDIRSYAKEYSILPEFKISSHMPYYVTETGGNFRAKNSSFLEIDGIGQNYRSSLTASNINYNSVFINSYVSTDNLDNEIIQKENSNLLKLKNIKFTVSGIKKLLPYNGFYPQERTIQLANLFNDYMDNNIGGGYFKFINIDGTKTGGLYEPRDSAELLINITQSADYFYKNTVLPYFFAPGILYNTIKSGISVSFPSIFISTDNLQQGNTYNVPAQGGVDTVIMKVTSVAKNIGIKKLGVTASYISNDFINKKINFEDLINPENAIPANFLLTSSVYMKTFYTAIEPTFTQLMSGTCLANIKIDCNSSPDLFLTSDSYLGIGWKDSTPFAFRKTDKIIDPSYSMAMSNFLAEIPRFFLKNGTMNVFKSAEFKDWKPFQVGKKYYFDLKMKKSEDLVMIEAYRTENHVTGTNKIEKTFNGRYFGWPVSKYTTPLTDDRNLVIHNDPAYAPFTPPYFEGEATLRFELEALKTQYESVKDLQDNLLLINIFDSLGQVVDIDSTAYKNKMSIADCMEIAGVGLNPIPSFTNTDNVNNFEKIPNLLKEYWAIYPKLETPVLDFSDQKFMAHTSSKTDQQYWVSSGYGRGMWSGYGKIPTGSKGITVELAESFPLNTTYGKDISNYINSKTGSLLDQVGFKAERTKIGQLSGIKTISEGIVMIPYIDNQIPGTTTFVDNHHFFSINRDIFNTLKNDVENGVPSVISGEQIGYQSSITKMIKVMKDYVIPPNFNFLKYDNINPFVMYIFEFKHDLDQQDLADIWQSVMPKIAINAEHDIIEFEHKIGEYELFGADFTPPENMRWMVFKVKKKAEWNYFAITENISDDQKFVFKFSNSEEARTPDYSYNWPYDYFSLVELAKVDISLTYDEKPPLTSTGSLQGNQFAVGNILDYTDISTIDRLANRRGASSDSRRRKAKRTSGKKK